jgi:hypothetical protein
MLVLLIAKCYEVQRSNIPRQGVHTKFDENLWADSEVAVMCTHDSTAQDFIYL